MKIVQFYTLLARRKQGLDSIICSLRDSIQNSPNWLLTSGSMVRVHHGSFNEINYLRAVSNLQEFLTAFLHPTAISKDANMTNYEDLFQTWIREKEILDRCSARTLDSYLYARHTKIWI